jgi:hypothetical protein
MPDDRYKAYEEYGRRLTNAPGEIKPEPAEGGGSQAWRRLMKTVQEVL